MRSFAGGGVRERFKRQARHTALEVKLKNLSQRCCVPKVIYIYKSYGSIYNVMNWACLKCVLDPCLYTWINSLTLCFAMLTVLSIAMQSPSGGWAMNWDLGALQERGNMGWDEQPARCSQTWVGVCTATLGLFPSQSSFPQHWRTLRCQPLIRRRITPHLQLLCI